MTTLREAAQQALEALEDVDGPITALLGSLLGSPDADAPGAKVRTAITALRAALAQQEEPVEPVATFDEVWAAIDWDRWRREPIRKLVRMIHSKTSPTALAQQAEPLNLADPAVQKRLASQWGYVPAAAQAEPNPDYPCRSDGRCQYAIDHGAEGLGSCPKGKCAIAQPQPAEDRAVAQDNLRVMREMFGEQAEPLNLRDPAVQKRLATQWGYVPAAQQAEPVEPVVWSGYDLDGMVEAFSRVIEAHYQRANPFQNPIDMDAQMALRALRGFIPAMKAYTAQPQRKPLPKHDQHCVDVPGYGLMAVRLVRAVERAHGIKE